MKHTQKFKFKRGQRIYDIYVIQGIGDYVPGIGQWWKRDDGDCGDALTITQDIEITITIRTPSAPSSCASGLTSLPVEALRQIAAMSPDWMLDFLRDRSIFDADIIETALKYASKCAARELEANNKRRQS